jgi:hypothetical protein
MFQLISEKFSNISISIFSYNDDIADAKKETFYNYTQR